MSKLLFFYLFWSSRQFASPGDDPVWPRLRSDRAMGSDVGPDGEPHGTDRPHGRSHCRPRRPDGSDQSDGADGADGWAHAPAQ